MRKIRFTNNEYYHIYNRGVEKRDIFIDQNDLSRFLQSMSEFNNTSNIGSIRYTGSTKYRSLAPATKKSVEFVCYSLCPNHYHFVVRQLVDKGVENFLHRLGSGYTNYFNKKYKRSGSLFQGTFKANDIGSDKYLLHVSAYVNLNNKVHQFEGKFFKSSWDEYIGQSENLFCNPEIVLNQFSSMASYKSFAENSILVSQERKKCEKELEFN